MTMFDRCDAVQLSVIIMSPRETDFLLDMPLSWPISQYSHPRLHDVSPYEYYTNYTRLDIEQFEMPQFDSYNTYSSNYLPSVSGTSDAIDFINDFCCFTISY